MPKSESPVEWVVAESDTEWQRLCAPPPLDTTPDPAPAVQRRLSAPRFLGGVAILLCLLAGTWWWRTDQGRFQHAAADETATAQQEPGNRAPGRAALVARHSDPPSTPGRRHPGERETSELSAAIKIVESPAYVFDAVQTFEVQGDLAVARAVMYTEHGEAAYRQTRFYQRTGSDWQQTAPDVAVWGAEGSLETPTFLFHFRQNDAPVVIAVAPQIEALYTTLRRNVGLPGTSATDKPVHVPSIPDPEKMVIEVSVTHTPGYATSWFGAPERNLVSSPARYLVPVELSDAELLVQSLALPLLAQVWAQAGDHYQIGAAWQPMLGGLRLWQLWDLDLPLAVWREEVVQWLYVGLPANPPGPSVVLPERYTALCAAHKLWLPSPTELTIPLLCAEPHWEDFYLSPWGWYDPLTRLDQLGVPLRPGEYLEEPGSMRSVRHPGHTVALATLIEYAVATYGRERLPVLVAGLGQYESWDTLIPAVFGVSAAEFEVGWQAYLAAHYGMIKNEVDK